MSVWDWKCMFFKKVFLFFQIIILLRANAKRNITVEGFSTSARQNPRIIYGGQNKRYPPSNEDIAYDAPNLKFNMDSLGNALALMADAIEKLDVRLRRVEEALGQVNLQNVGSTPITDNLFGESSAVHSVKCKPNFDEVGDFCIFVSVFTNQRANWKDALKECQSMGSVLAEVADHNQKVALSSYLSSKSTTAGYSYWLGGVYPGGLWIWLSSGQKVTLDTHYWSSVALPGDTKNGRCLGFHDAMDVSYKLAADECGYEKYFICQTSKMR